MARLTNSERAVTDDLWKMRHPPQTRICRCPVRANCQTPTHTHTHTYSHTNIDRETQPDTQTDRHTHTRVTNSHTNAQPHTKHNHVNGWINDASLLPPLVVKIEPESKVSSNDSREQQRLLSRGASEREFASWSIFRPSIFSTRDCKSFRCSSTHFDVCSATLFYLFYRFAQCGQLSRQHLRKPQPVAGTIVRQ